MCTDTRPWQVSDYLANAPLVGLPAANFVPPSLRGPIAGIAAANVPASAPATFQTTCQASLIIRGLFYFKCNPGDCGSPVIGINQTTQNESQALGIASMAGSVLPGIGPFVTAIGDLINAHVQAVATEQTTICGVAGVINQVFAYYDNLVRSGRISPSTAYAGMQTYLAQVVAKLQTIEKTCNAACVYIGILKAHSAFVQIYYPQIAPIQATTHAPGAPPVVDGTAPGGVIQVGGGASGVVVDVSGHTYTGTDVAVALALAVAIFVLISLATKGS